MSLPISAITQAMPVAGAGAISAPAAAGKPGQFASLLEGAIQGIQQYGNRADQAVQNLISGESGELHSVALAVQRADLAFDLGLQIRNKVVSAYQEVMRMQL
jgi:flagellar hook-basal body complex protein FliE